MSRNYNKNIVDEFLHSLSGSGQEFVDEECFTYADYGAIIRDGLAYLDSSEWDSKVYNLVCELLDEVWESDYEANMWS